MKYLSTDKVPDFIGIVDFADWWNFNGGFLLPPEPLEIYNIDVAATCVIFRHGRFQVEQYLLFPNSGAGEHGHPKLDTVVSGNGHLFNQHITVDLVDWGGEHHGAGLNNNKVSKYGRFFYIASHWRYNELPMTTVLCSWGDAEPLSSKHRDLLEWYDGL